VYFKPLSCSPIVSADKIRDELTKHRPEKNGHFYLKGQYFGHGNAGILLFTRNSCSSRYC